MVAPGAYAAHVEGAHAVGATHVELLIVRGALRIAITEDGASGYVAHQYRLVGHAPPLYQVGLYLKELCERTSSVNCRRLIIGF